MIDDKEIVYNVIGRYVDNVLISLRLGPLSSPIKNYVMNIIEPYINAFIDNKGFNADMASGFVKKEFNEKIEEFKKSFEKEKEKYEE